MKALMLCWALLSGPVDTPAALRGCMHAYPATLAHEDADLLLSVGYVETRWRSGLVSSTGCCGPWQVNPKWSSKTCEELDQVEHATAAAASSLRYWDKRCKGDTVCALRGYACGNDGVRNKCGKGYAAKVAASRRLLFGR